MSATVGGGGGVTCWCGSADVEPFGLGYVRCRSCRTLVSTVRPPPAVDVVREDEAGLYGKGYWFDHQEQDVGHPSIVARVRDDLPERDPYWLRHLLRHRLPPARTLELGCAHGGFVSLLRMAGYDASGLELSPWVARYAAETFGVPVLHGPVEAQPIEPGSLDVVLLFDVMEHLPDPLGTLGHCARLLKEDGLLVVQTPAAPPAATFADLESSDAYFLKHMRNLAAEHVYLYAPQAASEAMRRVGLPAVVFEPAIFAEYDMFFFAARRPWPTNDDAAVAAALRRTPGGRWAEALLTATADRDAYRAEAAARLAVIDDLKRHCDERLAAIRALDAELARVRQAQS